MDILPYAHLFIASTPTLSKQFFLQHEIKCPNPWRWIAIALRCTSNHVTRFAWDVVAIADVPLWWFGHGQRCEKPGLRQNSDRRPQSPRYKWGKTLWPMTCSLWPHLKPVGWRGVLSQAWFWPRVIYPDVWVCIQPTIRCKDRSILAASVSTMQHRLQLSQVWATSTQDSIISKILGQRRLHYSLIPSNRNTYKKK